MKRTKRRPQHLVIGKATFSRPQVAMFIAAFVAIGALIVLTSRAAGPFASLDAGSGNTLTGAATTVTDASAFGGSAVRFGTPTPTPGGGSATCPVYPAFPDANCTGWAHTGVTLKTVPGQVASGTGWNWEGSPFNYVKITGSNAILDGLDIQGCVYVDTGVRNITIKRSRIAGACNYVIRLDNTEDASLGLVLTDVEIDGKGNGAVGLKGSGFTATRVNVHDYSGKGLMTGSNTLVEDSYIHDPACYPPDHQSAMGTNGGASNIILRHNHVDGRPTECTSGGIANYDDFGAFHNILIEKNLINSGGYCLKAGFEDNNAAGNTGMQVLNNVFGRKYSADCGDPFGVVSNWMPGVSGNVWSGNTWGGGAAATSVHAIGDPVNP